MVRISVLLLAFTFFSCGSNDKSKEEKGENATTVTVTDDQLLETVQKQTFKYFWDYAEPNSGLARERYHPDGIYPDNDANIVTTGGSGFGLMAIVSGMSQGYVSKEQGVERLNKIADFLGKADRFHGAWSHWIDGNTGKVKPFGTKDNGGDLVETSFLVAGMITVREYLKEGSEKEKAVAQKYDALWKGVEWNWYTNNKNVLYWHWSPTYDWQMNFPLQGYNECLITYVMAASSPTHTIDPKVYHEGWARSGDIVSSDKKYNIPLVLKHNGAAEFGGPLFWAHYSYVGLDPNKLSDKYANYWDLNVNQTKINYEYCVENPKKVKGYGPDYWGLTASYSRNPDGSIGYNAHMPSNDQEVISPTAAISSIVYTPKESMAFIRNLYENHKEQTWGNAGFYDALSLGNNNWVAKRYLAIDQGPEVVMIENYRTGLLWKLFMNAPEVKQGLTKLGFHSEKYGI
ncbi:beta-glucosidase [Flavobacterium sp. ANB]|uniref:glucoamylase family protein n=1 Tax=unclassified Flavobacterium TaxID=196869 RepID=UPI0012B923C6|nr:MULTISPECIES: glucoamylase family protein [unclassified Flavobacterium]MBF4519291.1 beta-glucosidase [Flavobacterium sp. ANB]MTD72234.1 beta-glucosidase [Flavobacterium sp. LC2016-13]